MAKQTSYTNADWNQTLIRAFDDANDALRIEVPAIAISLDADSGDNIATVQSSSTITLNLTHNNTGTGTVVLGPVSVLKYSKATIYVKSTSVIASPPTLTLQLGPDDSVSDFWPTSTTAVLSGTSGAKVMSTPLTSIVARQIQVTVGAALGVGETATAYLVLGT